MKNTIQITVDVDTPRKMIAAAVAKIKKETDYPDNYPRAPWPFLDFKTTLKGMVVADGKATLTYETQFKSGWPPMLWDT